MAVHVFLRTLLLAMVLLTSATDACADVRRRPRRSVQPDTMLVQRPSHEALPMGKMSCSPYPVQMVMHGRVVRIQSDHAQILPIYTRSGSFYMAMRLQKGTNWLNGLPRGRYFINNRPITIN